MSTYNTQLNKQVFSVIDFRVIECQLNRRSRTQIFDFC